MSFVGGKGSLTSTYSDKSPSFQGVTGLAYKINKDIRAFGLCQFRYIEKLDFDTPVLDSNFAPITSNNFISTFITFGLEYNF